MTTQGQALWLWFSDEEINNERYKPGGSGFSTVTKELKEKSGLNS